MLPSPVGLHYVLYRVGCRLWPVLAARLRVGAGIILGADTIEQNGLSDEGTEGKRLQYQDHTDESQAYGPKPMLAY